MGEMTTQTRARARELDQVEALHRRLRGLLAGIASASDLAAVHAVLDQATALLDGHRPQLSSRWQASASTPGRRGALQMNWTTAP